MGGLIHCALPFLFVYLIRPAGTAVYTAVVYGTGYWYEAEQGATTVTPAVLPFV